MQAKIVFISDRLEQYHQFIRRNNSYEFNIELYNHAEANRRYIFKSFFDLLIIDLSEPWLAIPPWIREQAQHQYFYQVIFITDHALNAELKEMLGVHLFQVISTKEARESLADFVDRTKQNSSEHRYNNNPGAEDLFVSQGLLGNNPDIQSANNFVKIVARARYAPCLIRGEYGSGKSTCARLIHRANNLREDLYFIKNCENITTNELLGDLFGVETESNIFGPQRKGLLELYAGGTLVLTNIEKLPMDVQEALLLYLDARVLKRLGGNTPIEANTRIVGMTQYNLEWFIENQNFNSSLFFHLNAFEIYLPPLRERLEDIELLVRYYIQFFNHMYGKSVKSISDNALSHFKKYKWPGNVRELKDILERAVFICNSNQLTIQELPETMHSETVAAREDTYIGNCTIRELEQVHIERVLHRTNGNKSKAAGILDISRTTLREKMRVYGLIN